MKNIFSINPNNYFSLSIIIFIYFLNIQINIPGTIISFPAYDIIAFIISVFYLFRTNMRIKIAAYLKPYVLKLLIWLFVLFSLTFISVTVGVFIYDDELFLRDLNSALIYPRLFFYILFGILLSSNQTNYRSSFNRIYLLIAIVSVCFLVLISVLQYAEYSGVHIPFLGKFALSYLPDTYNIIRIVGTSGNPNWNSLDLNIISVVTFSIMIVWIENKNILQLLIMVGINVFLFYLILATFSRTGIISYVLLLMMFIYFLFKSRKFKSLKSLFLFFFPIAFILVTVAIVGFNTYEKYESVFQSRIDATLKIDELGQRADLWDHRLQTGLDRFPFGIGPSKQEIESIVDSEFISVLGNAGLFGLITYGIIMMYLIYKPLSLAGKRLPIELNAMLLFSTSMGVLALCYSITADFARNLRASSLIFMLHSFIICVVFNYLKNRNC